MKTIEQPSTAREDSPDSPDSPDSLLHRRAFLAATAAFFTAGCHKTITTPSPALYATRAETVTDPKTLAAAAEATEKAGLTKVEWFHPEGITEPKTPFLYIPYVHRAIDGKIHSREVAVYTQKLLQVVDILASNGVKEFHLEGQRDGVSMPAMGLRAQGTGPVMQREDLLQMIQKPTFPDDLLKPGEQMLFHMNALLNRRAAFCGAEDPSIDAAEYLSPKEELAAMERVKRVNAAISQQPKPLKVDFTYDKAGALKGVLFGTVEFPADEIERDVKILSDFDEATRTSPRQKKRESYLAKHFPNSVVIFGAGHLPALKPRVLAEGNSFCVITVHGTQKLMKEFDTTSLFMRELLRQIAVAKTRPKF